MRALTATVTVLVSALVCVACSSEPTGDGPTHATTASSTQERAATDSAPAVTPTSTATYPSDPVGQAMQWFVGQINSDPVDANVAAKFATSFTDQVPPEQILMLIGELRLQGPWTTENVRTQDRDGVATLVSRASGRFILTAQLDEAGLISGILITSAAKGAPATSWKAVVERARLAAPQVSVFAANVDEAGRLTPVFTHGAEELRPVASAAKLYVLAALAEQISAGKLSWTDQVSIRADDKTLPSGTWQTLPDGTTRTVEQAATAMISASDNTATDVLIRTVGEQAVLAAAARAGNDHPEGITPFLRTKQMFWLSYGDSEQATAARTAWLSADATARRNLLSTLPMPGPGPTVDPNDVQWSRGTEWFVTARDLADAHIYLQRLSRTATGKPLAAILTTNSGIEVAGWHDTAFKGGSNNGVIAMSLYARTADPARRQVLVTLGSGPKPVDNTTFIAATRDGAALMVGG